MPAECRTSSSSGGSNTLPSRPHAKVAFNETVLVEDGSRVQLNDDEGVPLPPLHLRGPPLRAGAASPPSRRPGSEQVWQRQNQFAITGGPGGSLPRKVGEAAKEQRLLH